MNFFESELKKIMGDSAILKDQKYVGRMCYGTIGGDLRARVEFVTLGVSDHYAGIKASVINRKEGVVDSILLQFSDIWGKPALMLRVDSPRSIYSQGKRTVEYFLFLVMAFGLLIGLVNLLLLKKAVLSRLFQLNSQVARIGQSNNPALRVQLEGEDELSSLGNSINKMLSALATVQNELAESDAATRALLDGMPDSLLRLNRQGIILDFKTSALKNVPH